MREEIFIYNPPRLNKKMEVLGNADDNSVFTILQG